MVFYTYAERRQVDITTTILCLQLFFFLTSFHSTVYSLRVKTVFTIEKNKKKKIQHRRLLLCVHIYLQIVVLKSKRCGKWNLSFLSCGFFFSFCILSEKLPKWTDYVCRVLAEWILVWYTWIISEFIIVSSYVLEKKEENTKTKK